MTKEAVGTPPWFHGGETGRGTIAPCEAVCHSTWFGQTQTAPVTI